MGLTEGLWLSQGLLRLGVHRALGFGDYRDLGLRSLGSVGLMAWLGGLGFGI